MEEHHHPVSKELRELMQRMESIFDDAVQRLIAAGTIPTLPGKEWPKFSFRPRRWNKREKLQEVFTPTVIVFTHDYNKFLSAQAKDTEPVTVIDPVDWAIIIEAEARKNSELAELADTYVASIGYIDGKVQNLALKQKSSRGELEPPKLRSTYSPDLFQAVPIGFFESCFPQKHGTPRQGAVAPSARGCLTLRSDLGPESLEGLSEYSHVWLIFVFHANTNMHETATFKAKIRPPRLNGKSVGVFATRSPHRVNPIGLSVAKLEKIDNTTIFFSGIDLIDGTPILDIKPYHPADCVPEFTMPVWMKQAPAAALNVVFTPQAEQKLQEYSSQLRFFENADQIRTVIVQSLSQDPRSQSKKKFEDAVYGLAVDNLNVIFRIRRGQNDCEVLDIEYRQQDPSKPRLRTQEWYQEMCKKFGIEERKQSEQKGQALTPPIMRPAIVTKKYELKDRQKEREKQNNTSAKVLEDFATLFSDTS